MRKLFVICILLMVSLVSNAQERHDELRARYLILSNDSTKTDSALIIAHKVKDAAIREFGKTSMPYFRALNNIGYIYSLKNDWKKSKFWWLKAYKELKALPEPDSISTSSYIYDNLKVVYLYHYPKSDSAYFFADAHIRVKQKILTDTTRSFLNLVCNIAFEFDDVFGIDINNKYYAQAREIRSKIFGKRSKEIVSGIDSILCTHDYKYLPDYRFSIYSAMDSAFTMKAIDSLSKLEMDKNGSWDCITYAAEMTDLGLKLYGDTSEQFIAGLQRLGIVYQDYLGNDSIATFCLNKALSVLNENKLRLTNKYVDVQADLASVYSDMKKYAKAVEIGHNNVKLAAEIDGNESSLYAEALNALGVLYFDTSYTNENAFRMASKYYHEAMALKKKLFGEESLEYAAVMKNLATACLYWGKLDSAEMLYISAYKILKNDPAYNLYYLSRQIYMTYSYKQDEAKSNIWLQKCIEIKQANGDTVSHEYLQDLHNYIGGSILLKDWEKAEENLKLMENIVTRHYDRTSQVYLLFLRIKSVYEIDRENYNNALPLLHEYISVLSDSTLYDQSNLDNKRDIEEATKRLAGVYLKQGKYAAALQANFASLTTLKELELHDKSTSTDNYCQRGDIMEAIDETDSAYYYYNVSLGILKAEGWENTIHYQDYKMDLAAMYWRNGAYQSAEKLMAEACSALKQLMVNNMAGFGEREKQQYNAILQENLYKYYSLQSDPFSKNATTNITSYNFILQSKGLLLNTSNFLNKVIASSKDTVLQSQFAQLKSIRKNLAKAYQSGAGNEFNSDSLEKAANKLEQQLSFSSTAFAQFQSENKINFNIVKDKLQPNEAAIEFVAFPYFNGKNFTDSVLLAAYIVTSKNAFPTYLPLGSSTKIAELVKVQGVAGRGIKVNSVNASGIPVYKQLYDIVWKPISPYLKNLDQIFIAADGILNNVSFSSLQDSNNIYLVDKYNLRFLLSSKDIVNQETTRNQNKQATVALFGGAVYSASNSNATSDIWAGNRSLPSAMRGGTEWNYLPNTLTEVNRIKSLLKRKKWQVKQYIGVEASEENIKALSGENAPTILHIATHGFYFPQKNNKADFENSDDKLVYNENENPLLRTGLIFSAANEAWLGKFVEAGKEDGILTAYEFANLDLQKTQVIVLSACETGIGDVMNGEGVYGLQRAIKQAGINKMLVSLWPVPDKETAEMMQEFYAEIAKGKELTVAFRIAQTTMSKRYSNNPALWAGFVLIE